MRLPSRRMVGSLAVLVFTFSACFYVMTRPISEAAPSAARTIVIDGVDTGIYALAVVPEGTGQFPAFLAQYDGLHSAEVAIASAANYDPEDIAHARQSAWIAAYRVDERSGDLTAQPALTGPMTPECAAAQVQQHGSFACSLSIVRQVIHGDNPPAPFEPLAETEIPAQPSTEGLGLWRGESVGLAYALGFLQHLSGDITPDNMVLAATGYILNMPDGSNAIGMVSGLPAKLVSAERAGANVVFIPYGHRPFVAPEGMRVIEVGSVEEAMVWLCASNSPSTLCGDSLAIRWWLTQLGSSFNAADGRP